MTTEQIEPTTGVEPPAPDTTEEWVCMGWRLNLRDERFQVWQRPSGTESWWPKRGLVPHADAGHVYRMTVQPVAGGGVQVYTRGPRMPHYLRTDVGTQITEWALRSEAAETQAVVLASGKNAAKASELKERLAPIREVYAKLPRNQRRALLAAVITEITWGA